MGRSAKRSRAGPLVVLLMLAGGAGVEATADDATARSPSPIPAPMPFHLREAAASPRVPAVDPAGAPPAIKPLADPDPPPPPARAAVDAALIPGRTIEPIDLISVLRLAGERDLDIAIAKQKVNQALADLDRARVLWLPSLFLGPTYYRADGQVQTITGQVQNVNRGSLFLGGTAALPNGFPGPSPGTGYPQLNSMTSILRISDTIFEPMAARRVAQANRAAVVAQTNDALLAAAEAYLDLQEASGRLAIAREAAANAEFLSRITLAYAKAGQGVEADHRRALAELKHQRKNIQAFSGRLLVASTNLTRLLVLDSRLVVAPLEPAEAVLRLIADDAVLDDLLVEALLHRPELAQSRELLQAAIVRLKQARLRPFIPSVAATYVGGGQGGGQGAFFGNFGARGDFMASLFWELQHLGFGDLAIMKRSAAEKQVADLQLIKTQTQVAADVTAAFEQRLAAARQIAESRQTVSEAVESLRLNLLNMQEAAGLPRSTLPIEVLQPIQALAQARLDYLDSVILYNRTQFRLKWAIGQQP